jgi:4-amino-4-deoxy-L-arabinose transferase-like glycosyltransferase
LAAAAVPIAIVALAAALRLWMIEADGANPFYDAAVRSMGLSWHNFFFGALEPSGSLAIDKPPVDLWLQVISTKLLGFTRAALALPEALSGTAAVALLYAAVTRAFGRLAGALAALALAVLPIAVLTSRSDTMDSLMAALLIAALWAAIVAVERQRAGYALLSAGLVGVAFDVKLSQALVPLPALAILWWAAARPGRRLALTTGAGAMMAAVALAWPFAASLTPTSQRPMPIGSGTGSIYRSIFLFNGLERLTGSSHGLTPTHFRTPPGFARLIESGKVDYGRLVGFELLGGLALALAALAPLVRRPGRRRLGQGGTIGPTRQSGAGGIPTGSRSAGPLLAALAIWLATGYLLFSFMRRLEPRYLEALAPAVAATLGIAGAFLWRRSGVRRGAWLAALALSANAAFAIVLAGAGDTGVAICLAASVLTVLLLCLEPLRRRVRPRPWRGALLGMAALALLAAPADASIDLVERHASDASPEGAGVRYSRYLLSHRDGARYEVAAESPLAVVALVAHDGQPVLIFRTVDGLQVRLRRLRRLVSDGAVRYALIPNACRSGRHCAAVTAWTIRHSREVKPGLYRYLRSSAHG